MSRSTGGRVRVSSWVIVGERVSVQGVCGWVCQKTMAMRPWFGVGFRRVVKGQPEEQTDHQMHRIKSVRHRRKEEASRRVVNYSIKTPHMAAAT